MLCPLSAPLKTLSRVVYLGAAGPRKLAVLLQLAKSFTIRMLVRGVPRHGNGLR